MIRHLHPTDSAGLLPFRQAAGRAEACTLAGAIHGGPSSFPAVRYTGIALSPRAWQSCWVQTRRTRIQVLLRAGPRSGPLAWEIRDLYLRRNFVPECWDVLEQLSVPAGRAGARRLFVRLFEGSPLFEQARQAGYMTVNSETVYRTASAAAALKRLAVTGTPLELRSREKHDTDALFRLYCASTPLNVRQRVGQTVGEWSSAIERPWRKANEWVLDHGEGRLDAWLQTADTSAGRYFDVMCSRDAADDLQSLVAAALSEAGDGPAVTMVAAHNRALAALLEDIGFVPVRSYEVMVRMLAVRVAETRGAVAAIG
ncbi:MAG: hypothetical protein WD208_08160 [Dehalococcoidia bacterium]